MDLFGLLQLGSTTQRRAQRWAQSGGMWLTGHADGPPLGVAAGVTDSLDAAASTLQALTSECGTPVHVDGPCLVGERAAVFGFHRRGDISCGGATRLLAAADGWLALALPRPADADLLPAWLGVNVTPGCDPWPAIAAAAHSRTATELVATGGELGLAVARLGERSRDRQAVVATQLGDAAGSATLHGLRAVDLSALWAGPLCGQLLASAGMEVVKVESTQRPDGARSGPAAFFDLLNAQKASVALDFADRRSREALHRLLLSADVVIESSRPRALEQLDLDAAHILASGMPRVWLSITAHGRDDEHRHRVGFGDDAAVAGGLVAGNQDRPVFCADAVADPATGLLGATAIVDRLRAGGRWLLDVALARTAALLASGGVPEWRGAVDKPHARRATGRAVPFGYDTERILGQQHRAAG